ncbi:Putative ribonuclease H protein At1g65750 [Linum perenne]
MTDFDNCRLCPGLAEDGMHVLRDCTSARDFWKAFLPPDRSASFFVGDINGWLSNTLNDTEHGLQNGNAMWLLWKARNEDIFEGKKVSSDQLQLRVHSWIAGVRETMRASSNLLSKMVERRWETLISWIPAMDDWTTVNTDGSVIQPLSLAAGGIVIRDWDVHLTHTFREGNRVADLLAHLGHSLAFGCHHLAECNPEIWLALLSDCIGVALPKSININS